MPDTMPRSVDTRRRAMGVIALIVALAAWNADPWVRRLILVDGFGIQHIMAPGSHEFAVGPFTLFLAVRLCWYALVFWSVLRWMPERLFLPRDAPSDWFLLVATGLLTGACVMALAISGIILLGDAAVAYGGQAPGIAGSFAAAWLVSSLIGAAAEEVFFRGLLFVALRRVGGLGLAIVGSAFAFAWIHADNPGASPMWLVRLFLQGCLLAYAVVRTRSLGWSIGYHAGWNWASAPLFGAAGSGYGAQGHVMAFTPLGAEWLTGGDVGPEGSVLAFFAMGLAFLALLRIKSRPNVSSPVPQAP